MSPQPLLLALRALGLGDLLTAVPALRGLRRAFPGHELTLATPAGLAPLVELVGAVDRILDVPQFTLDPLPALPRRPALAVNLHGRGPQSTARLRETDPERLVAFDLPGGPAWDPEEHEVHRWCRLLAAADVSADPGDLALALPPEPPVVAGAAVVHPGAASPARRWPADRFAAVARSLAARGLPVVVTGGDAERELACRVVDAAGLPGSALLAGRTSLRTLAATVAAARLVVSGDTGVAHLATSYAVPSVVLFGPIPPALWGPPVDRPQHRALWAGRRGDPHGRRVDPGLLHIRVDDVVSAACELLAAAV